MLYIKRRIISSAYPKDHMTLEDAWKDIMEYPVARKLYYQMLNMSDADFTYSWLSGVLAAGNALNRGDFDGLQAIHDSMEREGISNVLSQLSDIRSTMQP